MTRTSIIWTLPREEFIILYNDSVSLAAMLRELGYKAIGNSYNSLKERIKKEGLDIQEILKRSRESSLQRLKTINRKKVPTEELLVSGTKRDNKSIKKRLVSEGLIKNECCKCGTGTDWQGESLTLHLDHINGDSLDYRIENIRLLCPNCHSQTDTYCSRNRESVKSSRSKPNTDSCIQCGKQITGYTKTRHCASCYSFSTRKAERPSRDVLLQQVKELGYCGTGRLYKVSDNAIRKWLR